MPKQLPIAYKGDLPYIFISYAHKDTDIVLPIIERLQKDGYRVWYDEGIASGSSWDIYISEHLDQSANILSFLSKSYIKSQNCRDELALARQKGKTMNLVYIDDVQLSPGLKMRYGRIQALFLNKMSENEFFEKLYRVEAMASAVQ
ncbi:MAG: toll/interleukin-1 receptor domain-containing protein [Clostridia bacterium]|nr:toll/interleukin-1 receptor domain-containing protein [Clostridia bacterium]